MGGWGAPPREPRWPRARARSLAADLLVGETLRADALITHRFALADAPAAYELIDREPQDVLRAVLVY
jgi:hypothetical protein